FCAWATCRDGRFSSPLSSCLSAPSRDNSSRSTCPPSVVSRAASSPSVSIAGCAPIGCPGEGVNAPEALPMEPAGTGPAPGRVVSCSHCIHWPITVSASSPACSATSPSSGNCSSQFWTCDGKLLPSAASAACSSVASCSGLICLIAACSSAGKCSASRPANARSEEHTSELQSRENLVCRLLLE